MQLSDEQLQSLNTQGFLILPGLFSSAEVDCLCERLPALFADGHEGNIIERASGEVRTSMGLHLRDERFDALVRHPRLVGPALQVRAAVAHPFSLRRHPTTRPHPNRDTLSRRSDPMANEPEGPKGPDRTRV